MPVLLANPWLNVLAVLFLAGVAWSAGCWLWAVITGALRRPPP